MGGLLNHLNLLISVLYVGIGYEAIKRLASDGHTIVLPCRTMKKSLATVESLSSLGGNLIAAECNLASLRSVQKFAKELPSLIGDKKVDVLGLNAGLIRDTNAQDCARTEDGFELTSECSATQDGNEWTLLCVGEHTQNIISVVLVPVGTNHIGHFALNKLLLPMMNRNNGRIVVTASGVHDPESPGKPSFLCLPYVVGSEIDLTRYFSTTGGAQGETASLGDLQGLERDGKNFEMVDGNAFNADKAYKDSKVRSSTPIVR